MLAVFLILVLVTMTVMEKGHAIHGPMQQQSIDTFTAANDYIESLTSEGYSEKEIMEARLQVEKLFYELKEIARDSQVNFAGILMNSLPEEGKEAVYSTLLERFSKEEAICFLVRLGKEFESSELLLNEYLASLQLGISFADYAVDRRAYQKQKEDKKITVPSEDIITTEDISEKLIETIQRQNSSYQKSADQEVNNGINGRKQSNDTKGNTNLPAVGKDIEENQFAPVKPVNPLEEIHNEVSRIK